jgi:hypothetical protein
MSKTAAQRKSNREYMARKRAEDPDKSRAYERAWYAANRERRSAYILARRDPAKHNARSRKYRTGFTQADWDEKFAAQSGLCAICRERAASDADHNHTTGQKRGLLCRRCNITLGLYEGTMRAKFDTYLSEWNGRD